MPRKSAKTDAAFLLDIDLAAEGAMRFSAGMSFKQFMADEKTRAAVLHELLVLGEATKRLSDQVRAANPEIPWKKIAGNRDRLIHGYDEIDFESVWNTLTVDLPALRRQIAPLLPPNPDA